MSTLSHCMIRFIAVVTSRFVVVVCVLGRLGLLVLWLVVCVLGRLGLLVLWLVVCVLGRLGWLVLLLGGIRLPSYCGPERLYVHVYIYQTCGQFNFGIGIFGIASFL